MGEKTQVFRSPEDIPSALRKQLVASTRGMNSATILIADRGGRAEIKKILNGEPSPLKSRLRAEFLKRSIGEGQQSTDAGAHPHQISWRDWGWRQCAELLLPAVVGVGLWLMFTWK